MQVYRYKINVDYIKQVAIILQPKLLQTYSRN